MQAAAAAAAAERAQTNKDLEDSLRLQVELSVRKLDAAKINKKTDLEAWVVAQQQIIAQEYKIRNEEIYIRFKKEGLSEDIRSLLVQENRNKRKEDELKLEQQVRNIQEALYRAQEQANKKALDAAKQIERARFAAQVNEVNTYKAVQASTVALTRQKDGELAAAKQRLQQLNEEMNYALSILSAKTDQRIQESKSREEAEYIERSYVNQYNQIVNNYEIERLKTRELIQQRSIVGAIARLSSAAGFRVQAQLPGAFIPIPEDGAATSILTPENGGAPLDFLAGGQLTAAIEQEVALARVLEKYKEIGEAAQITAELATFGFRDMIEGTKTAEQAFAEFLRNIADLLLKTAATMIAQYVALGIARAFATGSSPASFVTGVDLNKNFFGGGGLPFTAGLPGFANGGNPPVNKPSIVGERGPELFVPRSSGTIIPNDKMMGGTSNVVVNVDASGSKVEGDSDRASQFGKAIGAAIQAELIKQKRPGGLLANT